MLYFPLQMGHYVTYNVDSIYYNSGVCTKVEHTSQAKYIVSDTFRDNEDRLSYIIDVQYRATVNDNWVKQSVVLVTSTDTGVTYGQGGLYTTKLIYPLTAGAKWYPNTFIPTGDSSLQYLSTWTSSYLAAGFKQPYNTGTIYFDNTITVLEDDETINNTIPDSITFNYRSYAKEIYAHGVGMVYRENTRLTYDPNVSECIGGISVTMSAVDHN